MLSVSNASIKICLKYFNYNSWDGSATCIASFGEQALVDILDLSEAAWTCWGCFYTQQWARAEDGEGSRPAAGTGNV